MELGRSFIIEDAVRAAEGFRGLGERKSFLDFACKADFQALFLTRNIGEKVAKEKDSL